MQHTGATALLVTHEPDKGTNPLGGSAWRANIQTRIRLARHRDGKALGEDADFKAGDTVTLMCKKQSGAAQFPDIVLPVSLVTLSRGHTVPVLTSENRYARVLSAGAERQRRYRERHRSDAKGADTAVA